jgi:hypothetical protein
VKTVMNLQVPQKAGNFLTSQVTISSSRRPLLHGVSWLVTVQCIGSCTMQEVLWFLNLTWNSNEHSVLLYRFINTYF